MTPSSALSRLREIAVDRQHHEEALARLRLEESKILASIESAAPAPGAPAQELIPLAHAASRLGLSYDATRKAAGRAGRKVRLSGAAFVWREWLDCRLSGLSVRSTDSALAVEDAAHVESHPGRGATRGVGTPGENGSV
jgi:hypothetical protein